MYNVHDFGWMMADRVRTEAFTAALRRAVRPGCVVADIGTGAGVHAFLACKLGARRVYAIEPLDVIEVAQSIARANGFADRIEFIQALSTEVELPERADVIVSDLRGALPLYDGHLPSILDARRRLLAPGGVLIPQRDTLRVAVAEAPEAYGVVVDCWDHNPVALDMSAGREPSLHGVYYGSVREDQLLTDAATWATVDYPSFEQDGAHGTVVLTASRSGVGHVLASWFEATLVDGVGFSTAPGAPDSVYKRAYLPWSRPVFLAAGDEVHVELRADRSGGDYVWTWRTRVVDCQGVPSTKAEFSQSTFFASPLSARRLQARSEDHVAELNRQGMVDSLVLGSMAAGMPLGRIAEEVASRFPLDYPTRASALAHVGELAERYSR